MLNKVKHMTANLKNNNSPVTIVYPSANISTIFYDTENCGYTLSPKFIFSHVCVKFLPRDVFRKQCSVVKIIVNRGKWLGSLAKFFVLCLALTLHKHNRS